MNLKDYGFINPILLTLSTVYLYTFWKFLRKVRLFFIFRIFLSLRTSF